MTAPALDLGVPNARLTLARELRARRPADALTVSQWADRHRVVSSYSAEPGRWMTARTPYLREIMDALCDPTVQMVVFQKPARIGGTEAGLNIVGYYIDQDPSPVLIVQPTVDDAKDFSKEQLAPTIEDTECLRRKVAEQKAKDSGNTVMAKVYPGGALYLIGANSPRGFRRRTARLVVFEEVDGYPPSAGTEGDQIKLGIRRAATFGWRRKIFMNSTPTLKGFSRIADYFERGDQRHYEVPCPDCGTSQVLAWPNLRWDGLDAPHLLCTACGVLIPEERKLRMLERGRWVPSNPGAPHRSYHINALYSPWVTWGELRDEWLEAQSDPAKLQVFVNTALGETWEDRAGGMSADVFEQRREAYDAEIPTGVRVLTCGVDVQEDRIEAVVRGWGRGKETWLIRREILLGNTTIPETEATSPWRALGALLTRRWTRADGAVLLIAGTGIDSGYNAAEVYKFGIPRYGRGVFVTRGHSEPGKPLVARRPSRNNKARCPVFYVGTDTAKDQIFGRLKIAQTGPLYWHFPIEADRDYFDQLTAEKAERKVINGKYVRKYTVIPGRRNEVLDCEVGNIVALELWGGSPEQDTGRKPQPPAVEPRIPAPPRQGFVGRGLPGRRR
jgi:phage terminase large subunit GpA-like protein